MFLLLLLLLLLPLSATAQDESERRTTGLILLRLDDPAGVTPVVPSSLGVVVDSIRLGGLRFLVVNPFPGRLGADELLADLPGVKYVAPDIVAPPAPGEDSIARIVDEKTIQEPLLMIDTILSNDPLVPRQWHIVNDGGQDGWKAGADVDLAGAWLHTRGNPNVVIAIGEEGYDTAHPDLQGIFVNDSGLFAAAGKGSTHGTYVVGVVAAQAGNNIGGVGIAPLCRILVVHTGYGASTVNMLKALEKVLEWNPAVFTNSWGYLDIHGQPLQEAYEVVARAGRNGRGTLVIFAGGNDRRPWIAYPGWYEGFVAVGGTNPRDLRWSGSNYGQEVDVVAPAEGILTTTEGGGYGGVNGTSFAAPIVAGVAGLIASLDSNLTADSIRAIIELTADKVGGYNYDERRPNGRWSPWMGYGRVNAALAIERTLGLPPSRPSLIWPRGGEEIRPDTSYLVEWRSNRAVNLIARSIFSGRIDTIGKSASVGHFSSTWVPRGSDVLELALVEEATGLRVDSTSPYITVRKPAWTVVVDTLAPFVDILDFDTTDVLYVIPSAGHLVTPFDIRFDGDTASVWNVPLWGLANAPLNDPRLFPYPTIAPGVSETPAVFSLLSADVIGVDSTRIALFGPAGDRTAIVQYDGLRLDTVTTTVGFRASMKGLRRQVMFREKNASITLSYDRAIEGRGEDPLRKQRGGYVVGFRSRREFLLPYRKLFVDRVPAGTVTFTPLLATAVSTPPKTGLFPTSGRATYGYDVYRASVITSGSDSLSFSVSTDEGTSWSTQARVPPPEGKINYLIPTRFNGRLLVAIDGTGNLPRRDTLQVRDHGYTIEELDPSAATSISDDPRAARIMIPAGEDEFELPLAAPFPFFGQSNPTVAIGRDGALIPLDAQGRAPKFPQISVYPRFGRSNPDRTSPIHLLIDLIDGKQVSVIEWDSLSTFGDLATHRPRAQAVLYPDGTIDVHLFDADTVTVPYYTPPSLSYDNMILRPPPFTLRPNPQGDVRLPIGSWRFIPHTPTTDVPSGIVPPSALLAIQPNPARDRTTILTSTTTETTVFIHDLLGREVARLAGVSPLFWDIRNVPVGIYVVSEPSTGAQGMVAVSR